MGGCARWLLVGLGCLRLPECNGAARSRRSGKRSGVEAGAKLASPTRALRNRAAACAE